MLRLELDGTLKQNMWTNTRLLENQRRPNYGCRACSQLFCTLRALTTCFALLVSSLGHESAERLILDFL